jgi:hypothetical protein
MAICPESQVDDFDWANNAYVAFGDELDVLFFVGCRM